MKHAVIDMGTNVFALLLAEDAPDGIRWIREQKVPVRLGDGGLARGRLSEQAFASARRAYDHFKESLDKEGNIAQVRGYATSAFREAANGADLRDVLIRQYGYPVEIISGEREAELIATGILAAVPDLDGTALLMDIGGGSNEFILVKDKKIVWKRSFPLGMARMLERFQPQDPIREQTVHEFGAYCTTILQPLRQALAQYPPQCLVGSSGSFETFRDLMFGVTVDMDHPGFEPSARFDRQQLEALFDRLVASDRQERSQMAGMTPVRVDFIVLAALFTRLVLSMLPQDVQVRQSSFSLKEGAMVQLMKKQFRDTL